MTFCLSDAAILSILTTISQLTARHVQEQTLPLLFAALPDTAPERDAVEDRAKYWRALLALSTLCVHPELFETLVVRLTTKLDLVYASATGKEDVEPDAAYAHSLLKTLADTLQRKVDAAHPDVTKYLERLVPRIFNLFIHSALQPGQDWLASDTRLISISRDIITLITQCLTTQ
jgi:DNA repair/transcription protein MET18/MMS19